MAQQPYPDGGESSENIDVCDASADMLERYSEADDTLSVAVIAGTGEFDSARARLSGQDGTIGGVVSDRLDEAGLNTPDEIVVPGDQLGDEVGQGFGVVFAKSTDADLRTVELDVSREQTSDWDSDDWGEAFESRRETVLDQADALLVIFNGDSVGPWVNDSAKAGTPVYAPAYERDGDADSADIEEAVQAVVSEVE
jgi:hypothetical protein